VRDRILNGIGDLQSKICKLICLVNQPTTTTPPPGTGVSIQQDDIINYKIACEHMEGAFSQLEKGNFQAGLDEIDATIKMLGLMNSHSI
jgi:hypothetical protein